MKLKTLSAIVLALSAVPAGANTCGIHDHLCRAHGLGAAHGSVNRDRNAPTGAVIYMQKTDTNAPNTDVDNHVLGAATDKNGRSNGSFNPTYTDYGARNPSRLAEWDTPDTKNRHIYGSAYANQFNNGQALAVHTGDFDGGENGKIPNATGCPTVLGSSKQNCEAVIITGNMPSGIYSQKAEMFNYHGVANPKADLTMGAYATGNMALISRSHVATSNGVAVGKASNRVEHHTTLSGHGAKTQQYDYEFVNRGHKGHGAGTTTHNHLHNPARTHEPLRVTTEKLLVNTGKHEIPNFARYDAEQARNSLTVPDDPRVTVKRQPSSMLPETQGTGKTKGMGKGVIAGVEESINVVANSAPILTTEQTLQPDDKWLSPDIYLHGKRKDFSQNNTNHDSFKPKNDATNDDAWVMKNNSNDSTKPFQKNISTDDILKIGENVLPVPTAVIKHADQIIDKTGDILDKVFTNNDSLASRGIKPIKDTYSFDPFWTLDNERAFRIANLMYRDKDISSIKFTGSYLEPYPADEAQGQCAQNSMGKCKYLHTGLDFVATKTTKTGVNISSIVSGTIVSYNEGKVIIIPDTKFKGEQIQIAYFHLKDVKKFLSKLPKNNKGQFIVKPGDIIGVESNLGKANGVHTHIEFRKGHFNEQVGLPLPLNPIKNWGTNQQRWKEIYMQNLNEKRDSLNPLDYIDEIESKFFANKK